MTDTTPQNLCDSDRSERVREVVLRFERSGGRPGKMLALNDAQLFEVGMLISDRGLSTSDAWRAADKMLGGEAIKRSTFYRFASRFKSMLGRVHAGEDNAGLGEGAEAKLEAVEAQLRRLVLKVEQLEAALSR